MNAIKIFSLLVKNNVNNVLKFYNSVNNAMHLRNYVYYVKMDIILIMSIKIAVNVVKAP